MEKNRSSADFSLFKRQHCTVCGCEEKFNFHVPDDVWIKVIPEEYRNRVICLSCFDGFARDRGINYADAITELYFAGDKAAVKFEVESAQNV